MVHPHAQRHGLTLALTLTLTLTLNLTLTLTLTLTLILILTLTSAPDPSVRNRLCALPAAIAALAALESLLLDRNGLEVIIK